MASVKLSLEELNRVDVETYREMKKVPLVVILDDIRSALNGDCFAIEKIILCGITAKPPHKEIFKTAIGATESVEWEYKESIIEAIESLVDTTVIAIEQTKTSIKLDNLSDLQMDERIAIILGNEVKGVNDSAIAKSDYCLEIPQYGTKHSLNVSVCCGIVLWSLSQYLRNKK